MGRGADWRCEEDAGGASTPHLSNLASCGLRKIARRQTTVETTPTAIAHASTEPLPHATSCPAAPPAVMQACSVPPSATAPSIHTTVDVAASAATMPWRGSPRAHATAFS